MHKDEWGMIVNAPAPPGAGEVMPTSKGAGGRAPTPTDTDAQRAWFLLPGEILLWQGAPREGAGWRCLLRDTDSRLQFAGSVLAVFALGCLVSLDSAQTIAAGLSMVVVIGGTMLAVADWRLRRSRYAVTDRRAIVIRGTTIQSVHHATADPQRHETRCGTTIAIGPGLTGNWAALRREQAKGRLARFVWAPSDDDPRISFHALDPRDAPFDLLRNLAAAANPNPFLRITLPIPGGFAQ